ncbi:MAG: hypothetical protein PHI31_08750 [Desulfuromonadaceae bacterium]|nr:hypothetical protein [Desulfuromonadaceae bacterium]
MKRIFSAVLLTSLLAINAMASESDQGKITKLETTVLNNETILKYESYEVGTIGGSLDVKFTAMVITDPAKASVVATGMKVTIIGDKNVTSSVYLDADEVKSLSDAVALIKLTSEKYATEKKEPYTELMYSSRGGFKFGYLNKGAGAGMFGSNSALFIRTPAMESILKDDEKRIGQMQSVIADALFKMGSK